MLGLGLLTAKVPEGTGPEADSVDNCLAESVDGCREVEDGGPLFEEKIVNL